MSFRKYVVRLLNMLQQTELLPTTVNEDYFPYQEAYSLYQGRFTPQDYSLVRDIVETDVEEDYRDFFDKYIDPNGIEYPKFICEQGKIITYLEHVSKEEVTKTEALVFTLLRAREDLLGENVIEDNIIGLKTNCLSDHHLIAEIFLITDLDKYCSMTAGQEHIFNRSNC